MEAQSYGKEDTSLYLYRPGKAAPKILGVQKSML